MSGQMRVSSAIYFGSWPKIPASYRGMLGYDAVILRLQPQDNPSYSTPFPRNLVCWLEPPLSHPPRTPQHAPNSPPTAQTRANRQHQHQPTAQQTQQQPDVQNMPKTEVKLIFLTDRRAPRDEHTRQRRSPESPFHRSTRRTSDDHRSHRYIVHRPPPERRRNFRIPRGKTKGGTQGQQTTR